MLRSTLYAHFSQSLNGVQSGPTERPRDSVQRMPPGWMPKTGVCDRIFWNSVGLIVVPKCLLDVGRNLTMAQRSIGLPWGLATLCGRYSDCRCQVLDLRCGDRCHYRVHLHCPANLRVDDQVLICRKAHLAIKSSVNFPPQAQRGTRKQHERSRASSVPCQQRRPGAGDRGERIGTGEMAATRGDRVLWCEDESSPWIVPCSQRCKPQN